MTFIRASFIALLFLFAIQARAQSSCRSLFFQLPHVFESKHLIQTHTALDENGVGVLFIQKKPGQEWFDLTKGRDPGGDARWGMEYLPESLQKLLHLAAYDHVGKPVSVHSENLRTLQMPSTKLILLKISKLAEKLKTAVPGYDLIQFFESNEVSYSNRLYLENFVKKSQLPLSDQGHLYEHDLNYHVYSSFVLPKKFIDALKIRAELLLEFNAFMKNEGEHSNEAKALAKTVNSLVLHDYVSRVDASTGEMFRTIVRLEKEDLSTIMSEVNSILEYSLMGQSSPQMHLLHLLNRPEITESMLPYLQKFLSSMPEKYKKEDLDETFLQNPAELYNESRSLFKQITKAASEL